MPILTKAIFQNLSRQKYIKILEHYGATPAVGLTDDELAHEAICAFQSASVNESILLDHFLKYISPTTTTTMETIPPPPPPSMLILNTSPSYTSHQTVMSVERKRQRDCFENETAKPGEQVAAKITRSDDNGSWILGNVLDYDPYYDTYEVQDEDDTTRVMTLSSADVKRLDDSASHINKGDKILAVFQETTSFYRAEVAKRPRRPTHTHGHSNWDVIVRFQDDCDEHGITPLRRVPAKFVIRQSDIDEHRLRHQHH